MYVCMYVYPYRHAHDPEAGQRGHGRGRQAAVRGQDIQGLSHKHRPLGVVL